MLNYSQEKEGKMTYDPLQQQTRYLPDIRVRKVPATRRPPFIYLHVMAVLILTVLIAAPVMAQVTFTPGCPDTIVKGDSFTIDGTGLDNGSVTVMVIGRNYFRTLPAYPDTGGNFSITTGPEETRNFPAGQYAVVLIDPGANGHYEIGAGIADNGNISITDQGLIVADMGAEKDLKASVHPQVALLLEAASQPGIDDVVTPAWFFVEEPFIHFDQESDAGTDQLIFNHEDEDVLSFSGTTNMGTENILTAVIYKSTSREPVISATLPAIVPGGREPGRNKELNSWIFVPDTTRLEPGEYFITVGWQKEKIRGHGTRLFTIPPSGIMPVFQAGIPLSFSPASSFSGILPAF